MTKYESIMHDIVALIDSNELNPGDFLPSEHALMQQYHCSRDTIRKAMNLLIQNGYIAKSQGRRSMVLDTHRFILPISNIQSFKEVAEHLGEDIQTKVLYLDKIHPDKRIAANLHLSLSDEVWMLMRTRIINGEAVILDLDFLRTDIIPTLPKDECENSLYEYLEKKLHLSIGFADKIITCQNITGLDEKCLTMKDYNMIVNVESFTSLEDGTVFQYTSSRHRPDRFRFEDHARRINKI